MFSKFCNNLRQQMLFRLLPVSDKFLIDSLRIESTWDVNNTVVIGDYSGSGLKILNCGVLKRKSVATSCLDFPASKNEVFVNHNLYYNLQNNSMCKLRTCDISLKFADEVEVCLISTFVNWSQFVIDKCLKNYFSIPKLIYEGDMLTINFGEHGKDVIFRNNKIIHPEQNIYFKCDKIWHQGKRCKGGLLCTTDKTVLKQNANIQSFVPTMMTTKYESQSSFLNTYFENLKRVVRPFLTTGLQFSPLFLLEGRKGNGKSLLIRQISRYFGMNLCTVSNLDTAASVYAQSESKITNILFSAKIAAPAILEIQNFENFGKNSEGQHDERIISYFLSELEVLFKNNAYPVVVFCSANEKNIPVQLRQIFLKIFEIGAPNEAAREAILSTIFEQMCIRTNLNLHTLSLKTHGFFLEDLKTLVQRAVNGLSERNDEDLVPDSHYFEALDAMQATYSRGIGAPNIPKVQWSDIGGLSDVKEEIIKTIQLPLLHSKLFLATGLKRSGLLLYGPPGTGKTLIAKAAATECNLCFLSVKGPELLNMYVGQSEQNIREVFERAREAAPCIIFFDELDSLAPNRGASGDSGGVMDRVVSQLLAEMDGMDRTNNIFIIGATNRPDLIDPALLRPGRFDKLLYLGPCVERESKISVLQALTKKFILEDHLTVDQIVDLCPARFSGAEFYGICSNAWMLAMRRFITNGEEQYVQEATSSDIVVTLHDFQAAIRTAKPSITDEDLKYFDSLKAQRSIRDL